MKNIFKISEEEKREQGRFKEKSYIFKLVQEEMNKDIRNRIININNRLDTELIKANKILDKKTIEYIDSEILSNILELELNINTIIMNFKRITGISFKNTENGVEKKTNIFKRGKIFFLLESDTSQVYGQNLIYLNEELKNELNSLEMDIDILINSFNGSDNTFDMAMTINKNYFKINSDINIIIEDINTFIDNIYGNISSNRDMNINLNFLLISAFLSIILFFPEFNNMLNLQDAEISYEDKLDEMIYEKIMEDISLEELIDIKSNNTEEDILDYIEDDMVKNIIKDNVDYENELLELEKNRIKFFISILAIILIPFIFWILFIAL